MLLLNVFQHPFEGSVRQDPHGLTLFEPYVGCSSPEIRFRHVVSLPRFCRANFRVLFDQSASSEVHHGDHEERLEPPRPYEFSCCLVHNFHLEIEKILYRSLVDYLLDLAFLFLFLLLHVLLVHPVDYLVDRPAQASYRGEKRLGAFLRYDLQNLLQPVHIMFFPQK